MQFFISFLAGVVLFYSFPYFPLSVVFISSLPFLYLVFKKRFFLTIICVLGLVSGIAYTLIRPEPADKTLYSIKDKVVVKGIFESYPIEVDGGIYKQTFKIKSAINVNTGEYLNDLEGQKVVLFSDREFDPGRGCECVIKFIKKRIRLNPGENLKEKIYAQVLEIYDLNNEKFSLNSKIQKYRHRVMKYIEQNFSRDSASLISSITTGHRADISEEMRNAFNISGLAHILSISGTHFGLFSVFLFGIFKFIIKFLPYKIFQRITIFLTPSQAAAILCIPFMLAYLGLSGASIPAVRSFIMINLFLVGLVISRKGFWLNSLVFAAFIIVIWEPEVIFSLSFQLSFIAVLFIGFSVRYRENEDKKVQKEKKVFKYLKNILLITLAASIGTAPLVAYYFHYLSLISPLSNLIISPLIGFVLIPLSVVSSFLYLLTGYFIFTPLIKVISDLSISAVKFFSSIPFADLKIPAFPSIIVLLFYTGFVFYLLLNKRKIMLAIPFVPIIIYFSLSIFEKKELTITYLDVGQGDSSVIELPDRKTVVIDTGKTGRETASFLKYRGKEMVDAVILSHVHSDHTGGLDYLIKRFKVKELWDNGRLIYPENYLSDPLAKLRTGIKHRAFSRGDLIEGKEYSIYVFHPYPEFYTMYGSENVEANNDSLVLKIKGRNNSYLFTGDIEEEAEEDIVHLGGWLKSDVIKIPHQGGRNSAYMPFFEAVSPQVAIISAGRENPFGHPHQETIDALYGVEIFRTDIDGAVKISESEKGVEIKTHGDFKLEKTRFFKNEMKNIKRLFETW